MGNLFSKAILVLFVVGLCVTFIFGDGGFLTDAQNIKAQTQNMLQLAQDQMENFTDGI
jgi:hypothetical protein